MNDIRARNASVVYKEPEKRRMWVTVVLSFLWPGLPMIYCGRLAQGIIVEAALIVSYFLFRGMMALIPQFFMLLIAVFLQIGIWLTILTYNISLTINTNKLKIPRLKNTARLMALVAVASLLANIAATTIVKSELVEGYNTPSSSMENTIYLGDLLIATRNIDPGDIRDGEIIIFKFPGDPRDNYEDKGVPYMKRVMARGGETIRIVDKEVFVNGLPVDEPSTVIKGGRTYPYFQDEYEFGPGSRDNMPEITVPDGKLFVMGDNRDNSSDSRFWGYVDAGDVIARPRYIYFSWDSKNSRVRLGRIGIRLDNFPPDTK